MTTDNTLERGRESYDQQAWADAYAQLTAADQVATLESEDLERLAIAAYLIGRDADTDNLLERAYQVALGRSDVERAARCAFWLGFGLMNSGSTCPF